MSVLSKILFGVSAVALGTLLVLRIIESSRFLHTTFGVVLIFVWPLAFVLAIAEYKSLPVNSWHAGRPITVISALFLGFGTYLALGPEKLSEQNLNPIAILFFAIVIVILGVC